MFVCLSDCTSLCRCTYPSVCLTACLACLAACQSVSLFVCLCTHLSIHMTEEVIFYFRPHQKDILIWLVHWLSLLALNVPSVFIVLVNWNVLSSTFWKLLTKTGRGHVRPGAVCLTDRVTGSHQVITSIACVVHNSANVGAIPSYSGDLAVGQRT